MKIPPTPISIVNGWSTCLTRSVFGPECVAMYHTLELNEVAFDHCSPGWSLSFVQFRVALTII